MRGHKEASEKYKVVCEACNRYFQDAFTRSGHINTYHKEITKPCGFCKSGRCKKDVDPDYRPSMKQLKKADKRGDK